MRILPPIFTLVLAATTTSLTFTLQSHDQADKPNSLHNTTIDTRSSSLAQASPSRLHRRIVIDDSCSQDTVRLVSRLINRIEMVSRFAVQGAALRVDRSGRGGRGGRGRPRDTFAESSFQVHFSPSGPVSPTANIPQRVRSVVRRRFSAVAEQAAGILSPDDREARRHQLFHCEFPGDPDGICHLGGHLRLRHEGPGPRWIVICPIFYELDTLPTHYVRLYPNKYIAMVESLLGSPLITRAQGFLTIGSGSSIETDVNRYLEYAHDLYYHPDSLRIPGAY